MGWRNEAPIADHIAEQFQNRRQNMKQACEDLAKKNEALFQFVRLNFREDPISRDIAFKNYAVHNNKKYWFFKNLRWGKELTKKNHALLEYIFKRIREELKEFDSCWQPPAPVDMEKMKKHWNAAKKLLGGLKNSGLEKEVTWFVKKEKRNIRLLKD